MPQLRDVTASLDTVENKNASADQQQQQQHAQQDIKKTPKKAKWHLGIRSQSKPQDIMNEVFKAMKANNMVIRVNLIYLE